MRVWGGSKGRERNPPPCSRHLGQVVYGCVMLWRQRVAQLPIPPPLLASWEITDSQTKLFAQHETVEMYWQKLPASLAQISATGGKGTLYTVYITLYKHLAGSFWVLRQNLQQVAPNQEKPHTTPLHSLIYSIYISVGGSQFPRGDRHCGTLGTCVLFGYHFHCCYLL
jgi:hypothetical protein